jgi:integrase
MSPPVIDPPSADHVMAMLDHVAPRYLLPLVMLEVTGMRVGELEALTWGDVDATMSRWRIRSGKTRAARRWVDVPPDLFLEVEAILPQDGEAGLSALAPCAQREPEPADGSHGRDSLERGAVGPVKSPTDGEDQHVSGSTGHHGQMTPRAAWVLPGPCSSDASFAECGAF